MGRSHRGGGCRLRDQPVAVEVVQLLLDVAAEAVPVVSVQPLPHDTHTVLTFVFVEGKVLYLGGDAAATTGVTFLEHRRWSPGRSGHIFAGLEEKGEMRERA